MYIDHKYFVREFVKRTKKNLEVFDKAKTKEDFEVTQRINSLFGLLIVPYEHFKHDSDYGFSESKLSKNCRESYHKIELLIKKLHEDKPKRLWWTRASFANEQNHLVSNFIKHLRNALCHSGEDRVLFINGDEKDEKVKQLKFLVFVDEGIAIKTDKKTNKVIKKEPYNFIAIINVKEELKELFENVSTMYNTLTYIDRDYSQNVGDFEEDAKTKKSDADIIKRISEIV